MSSYKCFKQGSVVSTKHGNVDTTKILFICSGAFYGVRDVHEGLACGLDRCYRWRWSFIQLCIYMFWIQRLLIYNQCKPSDLLPELQGRLPIRVELSALNAEDMKRILTEPEANLIQQQVRDE